MPQLTSRKFCTEAPTPPVITPALKRFVGPLTMMSLNTGMTCGIVSTFVPGLHIGNIGTEIATVLPNMLIGSVTGLAIGCGVVIATLLPTLLIALIPISSPALDYYLEIIPKILSSATQIGLTCGIVSTFVPKLNIDNVIDEQVEVFANMTIGASIGLGTGLAVILATGLILLPGILYMKYRSK